MKNTYIVVGLVAVVIIIGGVALGTRSDAPAERLVDQEQSTNVPVAPSEVVTQVPATDAPAASAPTPVSPPEMQVSVAGSYETYAPEKLANANDGSVVLFFKATWCPSCKILDADISKNAGNIPAGVTILATDYDTYTDLKKEYGVTTQHTLVQVDAQGTLLKKWSGGSTLETVLAELI